MVKNYPPTGARLFRMPITYCITQYSFLLCLPSAPFHFLPSMKKDILHPTGARF